MNIIDRVIELSGKHRVFVISMVMLAVIGSFYAIKNIPLDAIPDLSDTQVIVYAKWDRPPQQIEDQVTYPVVTALLGIPHAKDIRAFSDYGFSYIYVIFDEGTDIYWARSRVLEYLAKVNSQLPAGVKVDLGPDATGVGWVFEYALVDPTGKHSLQELTTFQNWHLKYALQSVKGVSGSYHWWHDQTVPNSGQSRDASLPQTVHYRCGQSPSSVKSIHGSTLT